MLGTDSMARDHATTSGGRSTIGQSLNLVNRHQNQHQDTDNSGSERDFPAARHAEDCGCIRTTDFNVIPGQKTTPHFRSSFEDAKETSGRLTI